MREDLAKIIESETKLNNLARRALEAQTKRTVRKVLGALMSQAVECAVDVEPVEGTTDPYKIAHTCLEFSTQDTRIIMGVASEQINPNDSYSKHLDIRRQNYPAVIQEFETLSANTQADLAA